MPEVSVVCIAKNNKEFKKLKGVLKKQTFKDFEFVTSTKKGIPKAWNDTISKAKGEIIVVTESDALPLQKTWLEEMVKAVKKYNKNDTKKRTLIRGIEVSPLPWCWCNFASYAFVLKNNKLEESYPLAEDTELFARLKKLGYKGLELPIAPVLHQRNKKFCESIKNEFLYGIMRTRIFLKYKQTGFKSPFKGETNKKSYIIKREIGIILSRIAFLFGVLIGFMRYYKRES